MGGPRGKNEGSACAGQGGAGAAQGDGWASKAQQQVLECPNCIKLPSGAGAARAARIAEGLSALLTLLIGHMRSVKGRESGLTRASDKV